MLSPHWADGPDRKCNDCGIIKPQRQYYVGNGSCKACYVIRVHKWQAEHPHEVATSKEKWRRKHWPETLEASRRRRSRDPEKYRQKDRQKLRKAKLEAIAAYGGECGCCGERHPEFLTIDHLNDDGAQHRAEMHGADIYHWVKRHGYPRDRFGLRCMNCNAARAWYGYCPHQAERERTG